MRIGNVEVASCLALAPMAGVTDMAFRQICRELGAGYSCTELVSAKALCYQDKKSRTLLKMAPNEHPAAAQIFGSDIACMAEAAVIAAEVSGAEVIDINMGCPVGKVVSNGDGSALMKDPEKAGRIAEAVVKASPVPVTVKMRRGWDKGSINAVELAKILEQAGAAALAVHPGGKRSRLHPRHRQRRRVLGGGLPADLAVHRGGYGHDRPGLLRQPVALSAVRRRAGGKAHPAAAASCGAVRPGGAADRAGKRGQGRAHRHSGGAAALRVVSQGRAPRQLL